MFIKNNDNIYRYIRLIIIWTFLIHGGKEISGQTSNDQVKYDTLSLKEGSVLHYGKLVLKIKADTTIILPSKTEYKIIPSKKDEFYRKLEEKTQGNIFTRELHNIIIVKPENGNKRDTFKTQASAQPYYEYQSQIIRHIIIKQLPVFGPTISDTLRKATSIIEKTANRFHFQTKKFLIHNNLLFKEEDPVDPNVLADNERILRSLPYIEDSKIEVVPAGIYSDSVDVIVIVKDNWTKAFNLELDKLTTGRFDIMNKSIFGLGQEVQNSFMWDQRKRPGTGYEGIYVVPNIAGSFFSGNVLYQRAFGSQILTFNVNRNFFTPNIKYAGGFTFNNVQSDIRYFSNKPPEFFPIEYNHYETWIGRSFLLNKKNVSRYRQNITVSGKMINDKFYARPLVTENSYYSLQNKSLFLFNFSFTKQNFFKSNQIYNFGRTEDIPVGAEIGATVGYEFNEFADRQYLCSNVGFGKFFGNFGYIHFSSSYGGFINKDKIEQGVFKSGLNYFSNLFVVNHFNFRQFITINHTQGINRFDREFINMNNRSGISGYSNDSVYGNQRINMKWETDCFTPWKIFDFKFVLFVFADHTWLGKSSQKLIYGMPYTGFGFGVRLRNDRLVFNTLQLRFTFFPNIPPDSRSSFLRASGEPVYNPPNFSPKTPSLIEFK